MKQEVAQQYIDDGSLKETAKLLLKAKARPFRSLRKRAFQEEGEFDSIGTDRKAPLFHMTLLFHRRCNMWRRRSARS